MTTPDRVAFVAGYGMVDGADGFVHHPFNEDDVRALLAKAKAEGRKVVLRGAGRSYGDAAYLAEAVVLEFDRMNRIVQWDPSTGLLVAEAGATIGDLWKATLPDGYWPPVVSGTMFPTVGGALGMNIHGKNAFRVGTLGDHVEWVDVMLADRETRRLGQNDPLFAKVISGAGLLGVILRAAFRMKKVASGDLRVLAVPARNWDEQFEVMRQYEPDADYLVSWVDCFGRGKGAGRGLIHAAWYDHHTDAGSLRLDRQELPETIMGFFPKSLVWRPLKMMNRRWSMRMVNAAKYRASTLIGANKTEHQSLVAFSFLLDYVPNWRWAYLPHGFIQYQSFVPKEHAQRVFSQQVQLQQAEGLESYLAVLKKHIPDRFLLSHGLDGYSLALDFRVTHRNRGRLWDLAHRMNDLVLDAGGRFYFAKDSTLRPTDVEKWLGPGLDEFRKAKQELDPGGLFASALAYRTGLIAP